MIKPRHVLGSVASFLAFMVCLHSAEADKVEITVGRIYEVDLQSILSELADEYAQSSPDVRIVVPERATCEQHIKLKSYLRTHQTFPDIVVLSVHEAKLADELPYCVSNDLIAPLDGLIEPSIDKDDFFPSLWNAIEYQDHLWGVPFYAESFGILYNKRMLEDSGIHTVPETWAHFRDALGKMTRDTDGDGEIDQWGWAVSDLPELLMYWLTSAMQNGGSLWHENRFDLSQPEFEEAFERVKVLRKFYNNVISDGYELIRPKNPYAAQYVQSYQLLDWIERATDWPPQFRCADERFLVGPCPQFGPQYKVPMVLSLYFAIRKSSADKEQACWDFIRWATSAEIQQRYVERYDFLPLRNSIASSDMFQTKVLRKPHLGVFTEMLRRSTPVFPYVQGAPLALRRLFHRFVQAYNKDDPSDHFESELLYIESLMNEAVAP